MKMEFRDYRPSDIDTLVALANNKRVSRYLIYTFPYPYTYEDAEFWVTQGANSNGMITKVITVDGVFVGSVGIAPQPGWRDHCAEIGYWIGEPYWKNGYATRALEWMTQQAFDVHGFRKLIAPILAPNIASARVLEKCGYNREGVLVKEAVRDDVFYDIHLYAKLK